MKAPDYLNPLTGFREWIIKDSKLTSPWYSHAWEPGINKASCARLASELLGFHLKGLRAHQDNYQVPASKCECGIYALKTPLSLDQSYCPSCEKASVFKRSVNHNLLRVWGVIRLWGVVEEHETGYRAEYAEPLSLAIHPSYRKSHSQKVEEVAEAYGLEAISYNSLFSFCR